MRKKRRGSVPEYDIYDEASASAGDGSNRFASLGWEMPEIDEEEPDQTNLFDEEDTAQDYEDISGETEYDEPVGDFEFDTDSIDADDDYPEPEVQQDFSDAPPVLSITSRMNIPKDLIDEAADIVVPRTDEIQIPEDVMQDVEAIKRAESENAPQPAMASVENLEPVTSETDTVEPQDIFTVAGAGAAAEEESVPEEHDAAAAAEDSGEYEAPDAADDGYDPEEYEEKPAKKKKKGFFSRFRKNNEEDDVYGGLKRKDISELQQDYNPTGEIPMLDDTYAKLFDDSVESLDEDVSESFNQIQRERRRRVAQAIENTGVDLDVIQDEFGVVAPPPVTVMAADPTATAEAVETGDEAADALQKNMMDQEKSRTMEIKLNVLNDTMEIQKALNLPQIDSDSAEKIEEEAKIYQTAEIELPDDLDEYDENADDTDYDENEDASEGFPEITDVSRYRSRTLPVHCIDLEALQDALNAEAADYDEETGAYRGRQLGQNQQDGIFEGVREIHSDESEEIKEDYTAPEDAKRVSDELKEKMAGLNMRTMVTGAAAAVMLLCGLIFEGRNSTTMALIYMILSLVLTCTAGFFCRNDIINGIKSLIKFRANADSAAAASTVLVLAQILVSFTSIGGVASGKVHIYGALAAGILFMNSMGKLSLTRRIYANFRFMTSRDDKYAVRTYDDYNTSLKLAGDTAMGTPVIVYQRKAGFLKRYLELSYGSDPSQEASKLIAPYALVVSLLIGFITVLVTKSPALGVSAVAAVSCGTTMVTNLLGINSLMTKLSRKARKAGAMISGYNGIEQLAGANAVMVGESDLFPKGNVVINGLKIFSEDSLEENVLAASSLIRETGGTVADVFEQIITDTGTEVPKVTNIVLEGENGVSGKVGEKTVLVGNRDILISHNITPPEREDIMKYLKGGKKALFIAVDGELKAMLVLTYNADKRRKVELQRLTENGVTLIVHSIDSNITTAFLSTLFDIPEARINVVHGDLGMTARELAESEISRADAAAATKGRVESLLSVMSACIKEKKTMNIVLLIQYLGVILGLLITMLVSLASGHAMSAFLLILFEAVWSAAVLLVPKFLDK